MWLDGARAARHLVRMIKAVKFASVPVKNQDKALAFYTEKLGFGILTDQPMGEGMRWIELKIPGAQTGIVLFTPPGHEDRIGTFTGLSFHCDDVEKTHAELVAKGVEFVQPPKKESWGTSAIFKDPDGNAFVLGTK
jgi:predicted enzyme related to lactoylglutathione lyase